MYCNCGGDSDIPIPDVFLSHLSHVLSVLLTLQRWTCDQKSNFGGKKTKNKTC